jgi:hypothetical protein
MFCTVEELQLTSISQFYIQYNYTGRFSDCMDRCAPTNNINTTKPKRLNVMHLRFDKSRHRAIKCRLIALIATPFHADNNLTLQQ